ncbi:uncharacterized protein LOC106457666 isoform X3 [Limulus polyphemus]|uniref:Uncharacterized protein LOC106457666 isoform X3 n=1 Tax=Limulus polyphemus TaxID=6850 RepID=A0ABM1S6X2_LIMPO|nr:uncharacterized protein LOC106457666 isoform X3 [Limulus polyphemus]
MIGIDNVCVMPKVQDCITKSKKENNEALAGLPEGELQKLLEEAVTFNRPSSEDSYLLQKLKAEHAELCKDVRQHSTSLNPEVSSSSFDTFSQAGGSGEASKRRDVCVSKFFHDPNTCRDIIRSVDLVEQRTGFSGRNNEDYSTFVSGSKQHESKSSVDLTFMKTLDSCVMMQPLEKDKGNKDYRAKHTNSLSDSPSEASFHKDDTFQITRTNGLSFEIISSSLDPMNIRSNILKDQFSAIDLHKKSVYISSHLSDLVSHELLDFSKLIDSSYLGVKQKPCHQNSFTDTQQKMDTTTNLVSSSEYMQDLKNSYNRPVDFEMKEMKKTKCMEEAINETSMLKRFLSVCNNHYAGCKSDGDKEDIQFDKVKVNENTAVLPKVFDCDAENPLSREVQSETVYVQPQIRNLRLRPLCSKLNEEMGFSPLELSGSSKTEIFSTEARNLQNDRANRKGKRLRGNTDTQTILFAKDIAGHRWDEDIDSLLAFINSSDQKLEGVAVESINSLENVDSLPRSSVHQVRDRKKYKVSSKEGKNGPNCKPKTNYEKSSKDHRNCVF